MLRGSSSEIALQLYRTSQNELVHYSF